MQFHIIMKVLFILFLTGAFVGRKLDLLISVLISPFLIED